MQVVSFYDAYLAALMELKKRFQRVKKLVFSKYSFHFLTLYSGL